MGLPPGMKFGSRYVIERRLGGGAMGEVYLARDLAEDRLVALKLPKIADDHGEALLARFQREVKHAASLVHPNICAIYESGEIDGKPFVSMRYVDGRLLNEYVNRNAPMEPRQAASLVRKVALAMALAHDRGIIHRDLKPANIMVDKAGEPIVMDFGLARGESDAALTQPGDQLGTIPYMPPEAFRGERSAVGPHGDVYSLGVILYELIAGSRPFEGSLTRVIQAVIGPEPPPPPSQFARGIPPGLDAACLKALAKPVGSRHAGMREFAETLDHAFEEPKVEPEPKAKPSRKTLAWVAVGIAVAALASLAWFAWSRAS